MNASRSTPLRPILTLTVNPALDVSTSTETVVGEHKMRCGLSRLDPGGGGINVSRVIQRLGGQTLAIYAAGGPTGDAYRKLIEAEGTPTVVVPIAGSTRESFTVDETSTGQQFRFVLQGPELTEPEWRACLARVARLARAHDARCIVDASGPALAEALAEGVYLVKPSGRELGELVGSSLNTEESQITAASTLVERGSAEFVALTLGGEGAVLASATGVMRLAVPQVTVQSTVGAGDSFLGAFVLRTAQGHDAAAAFRAAVAAGSATAMTPATELCHRVDVERLEAELALAPV